MAASSSERTRLLPEKSVTTMSSFTSAIKTSKGARPQAIAHRGYKAAFPENTMGAFRGAVEVGAQAIETDLHLSKDGVVVLSHDADLKRCFGEETKIKDCDWEYLQNLQTLNEPRQHMPRLVDLLEYLSSPGLEHIWVLLDIKVDDDANEMISRISQTLKEVKFKRPWNERILLGCWNAKYIPLCQKLLPSYSMAHIGFKISYARQFLRIPNVHFNMLYPSVLGPWGSKFMRDVRNADRSLFLWTVNDEHTMKWCLTKGVDGVITDDPKKYLELSDQWDGKKSRATLHSWGFLIVVWFMSFWYRKRLRQHFGIRTDNKSVREDLGIQEDSGR